MPGSFQIKDGHRAFASMVAAGERKNEAYIKAFSPKGSKQTISVKVAQLMRRPQIQDLIAKATRARDTAIVKANAELVPQELRASQLTVENLDSFHYSVIMGNVEVEEIHPVVTITKENGKEINRTVAFHRVKRKPNIIERQNSIRELYKRFGHYAPSRMMGAFAKVDDDGDIEHVERYLMLSNGEKVLLP